MPRGHTPGLPQAGQQGPGPELPYPAPLPPCAAQRRPLGWGRAWHQAYSPSVSAPPSPLMCRLSGSGTRETAAPAACPGSLLTPQQPLAGLSRDFKGGTSPWDSFWKAPARCEQCKGSRRSKGGHPWVTGRVTGRACPARCRGRAGPGGLSRAEPREPEGGLPLLTWFPLGTARSLTLTGRDRAECVLLRAHGLFAGVRGPPQAQPCV